MSQHNAQVLEEERKGIAENLAEQDTIRRCDAEASASALKHEQKLEHVHHPTKHNAESLKEAAKHNAKDLKAATKANAEKLKH